MYIMQNFHTIYNLVLTSFRSPEYLTLFMKELTATVMIFGYIPHPLNQIYVKVVTSGMQHYLSDHEPFLAQLRMNEG